MTWSDIPDTFKVDLDQDLLKVVYTEEYKNLLINLSFAYTTNEIQDRALNVTGLVLTQNPYQYTAYTLRRRILFAKNNQDLLLQELIKTHEILLDQPKNFQQWHHIREIIIFIIDNQYSFDVSSELAFTDQVFEQDEKNYHCWDFRVWILQKFGIEKFVEKELRISEKFLISDPLNNSFWSYRSFLFTYSSLSIESEFEFYKKMILKAPSSEPGWNFLVSLFDMAYKQQNLALANEIYDYARENCLGDGPIRAPALFMCVDNVWFRKGDCDALSAVCKVVAKFDVPRKNYWEEMSKEVFIIKDEC